MPFFVKNVLVRLNVSFCHKYLPYLTPKIWNSLAPDLKPTNNINAFKNKTEQGNFLEKVQRVEVDVHVYKVIVYTRKAVEELAFQGRVDMMVPTISHRIVGFIVWASLPWRA